MSTIDKKEEEKIIKYVNALYENGIGFIIDTVGTMYFNSEEDKRRATELEAELDLQCH